VSPAPSAPHPTKSRATTPTDASAAVRAVDRDIARLPISRNLSVVEAELHSVTSCIMIIEEDGPTNLTSNGGEVRDQARIDTFVVAR